MAGGNEDPSESEGLAGRAPSELFVELDRYLAHLRFGRNLAKNSLEAYGRDLGALAATLEKQGLLRVRELGPTELSQALLEQNASGLSSRSLARRVSALRGFLRYLLDEGKIPNNLEQGLPRSRLGRRLPRAAGEGEIVALLRAPDLSSAKGRRDRALLSLTYAAGLRASEVVQLTLGDLDLEQGTVSALGKGNKRRLVPVGELALSDLAAYLTDRLSSDAQPRRNRTAAGRSTPKPWLFPGALGRPLTRQAFWKIVKGYGLHAGLERRIHPHVLRHSFASHLIQGGADLRSVQLLLGHESITTTEIYTHVSTEHVRRAFEKSHPRA